MSKKTKKTKKELELERRMLAVEDTVEMVTEPDSEMLVAATKEEFAEDADDETGYRDRRGETPAHAQRRKGQMHILGLGEVS